MALTPIKNGGQIVWLKETSRGADSGQTGGEYESNRSKTENRSPLSSGAEKEGESNKEKGQNDEESGENDGRKSTEKKKRSERTKRILEWSEDEFGKSVNRELASDRIVMPNKAMEENEELEFTSEDCSEKSPDQTKRNLEDNEKELVDNVNQESVGEKQILERIVESEFISQSIINKKSEQKQRKPQDNEHTLDDNVDQESVGEEQKLEGNVTEREFTSQSLINKKSDQKQQKLQDNELTLDENVDQESMGEKQILEGIVERECTSQSLVNKMSEQQQRKAEDNEQTLVENVNHESMGEKQILEGIVEREFTSQSLTEKKTEQKQLKLQENEDTTEENASEESVNDRRIISEQTEGNGRFQLTSHSPIKDKRSDRKRRRPEDEDTLQVNASQQRVDDTGIISEEILEGNGRFQLTSHSPMKVKSKSKQRKLQENEDVLGGNVNEETVSGTTIASKKQLQDNVELERALQDHDNNNNNIKVILKRKTAKRKWGVRRESDSQESVGMKTPKINAREDGYCEDERNDNDKKTPDRKTLEGAKNISDGRQEENQIEMLKKNKKKKKEKRKKKNELSATESCPESTPTSSLDRKTLEGANNISDGFQEDNQIGMLKRSKKRKKEKRKRKNEFSGTESTLQSTPTSSLHRKTPEGANNLSDGLQEGNQIEMLKKRKKRKKEKRQKNSELRCTESSPESTPISSIDRKTPEGTDHISDGFQENHMEMLKKNKKKKEKRKKKSESSGTVSTPEATPTSSLPQKVQLSQSKDQQNELVERKFTANEKNKHQMSNRKTSKESNCDLLQKQESLEKVDSVDGLQKRIYAQQSKKKGKKGELNNMESAKEIDSSPTLQMVTGNSLNDSGYSENGHIKSSEHEQCVLEQCESVHQPRISRKRKVATDHEKETRSGHGMLVI